MAIPSSGPLTLSDIQTEFGGTNPISLSEYYAGGGLVPTGTTGTYGAVPSSGEISIQKFYGTSSVFTFNLTSGSNLNLRTQAIAAGWGGTSPVVATIPAGNTIQSASTGTAALTINGSFPKGVTLINNGSITGRGGNGGNGQSVSGLTFIAGTVGSSGGLALSVSVAVSIDNTNGIVAGGGGGGGGGAATWASKGPGFTGGGGGGGGGIGVSTGGAGGTASGAITANVAGSVGGNGTTTANGNGGSGGVYTVYYAGSGGAGGSYGSSGANGGAAGGGGTSGTSYSGGAAGACTSGNVNITWIATGTRNGALN